MNATATLPKPAISATIQGADIFAGLSEKLTQKRQIFETAKDRLELAIALEGGAASANATKESAQGDAINVIARGMIDGLISKEEASALYGDAYGYKAKADGTPGKTPDGAGNTLRKRSVLLAEAFALVGNPDISPESMPKWSQGKSITHDIAPRVQAWLSGEATPWEAYKELTERPKAEPVDLPFNEKKLLEILEAMKDIEKLTRIVNNPALVAAYDAIADLWTAKEGDIQF